LIDAANSEGAEFVLVAGDLFEDNAIDRILIQKTADILTRFNGPVYLIPGNHDPLVPDSAWDHPAWRSATNPKDSIDARTQRTQFIGYVKEQKAKYGKRTWKN